MNRIEIDSGAISKLDNGVTVLDVTAGREINRFDVQELLVECNKFTDGVGPLLIRVPSDVSISFAAMKESAVAKGAPNIAFVANKPTTLGLVNIVLSMLYRLGSTSNMKVFESQSEAQEWLASC